MAPGDRLGDLRVVSLNVWNSFFLGGPARAKRLRTIIRALCADYDVVLLQEAFVAESARACSYYSS